MNITIRQIVELVGVSAVVLSLLFVGYELRLARSIARSEALVQNTELVRGLSEYISSNADTWASGCMAEDLTSSEAVIFKQLISSVLSYHSTRFFRSDTDLIGVPQRVVAFRVARSRYDYPGFNAAWEARRPAPLFKEAVDEQYSLLVGSDAERNNDVTLCGSI